MEYHFRLAPTAIKLAIVAELQKDCGEFPVGVEVLFIVTVTGNLVPLSQPLTFWLV